MTDRNERQPTRVGRDEAPSSRRKTELYGAEPRSQRKVGDDRRIVGALVSYTWDPAGQLFEVREGRTHIGAGEVKGENRPADVLFPNDPILSSDHAQILVRQGEYFIRDLSSINGTTLNGKLLPPESAEPLTSPATIEVGQTVFTFVKFDVTAMPQARQEEPAPAPGGRPPTKLR
jgi:hypothetical protein